MIPDAPLLDAALKEQPNHWESYWVLANCSALTHQWEAAEEFYRRAVENIPSPNADLLFSWGGGEGTHTIANLNTSLLGGSSRPSLY